MLEYYHQYAIFFKYKGEKKRNKNHVRISKKKILHVPLKRGFHSSTKEGLPSCMFNKYEIKSVRNFNVSQSWKCVLIVCSSYIFPFFFLLQPLST
jgi:hypothetical protein